jgi:PDZ domain
MGGARGFKGLLLVGLLATTLRALPLLCAQPGELEKRYLHEAAQGHLENVYILRMFNGYVAFPRTFVLALTGGGGARAFVDVHTDSSLQAGAVVCGVIARSQDGIRRDVESGLVLPANPVRVEQQGALRIEYYEPQGQVHTSKVLITDSTSYLLLTGSATVVAKDLVDTYSALTGPPDVFSGNRAAGPGAPAAAEPPRPGEPATAANSGGVPPSCDGLLQTARIFVATSSPPLMIRLFPGTHPDAFRLVGFAPKDVIVAVNGRPVTPTDDVTSLLRNAVAGTPLTFSISRDSGTTQLTVSPETAQRALKSCAR